MPLVPAICTQCGSKLEIDSDTEYALCPYCHTPFVTEKAINNYNTTNVTNIGNVHADVLNISDDKSRDNRVKSGETFIKMNDYGAAEKIFVKLTEECPYDYRGWWGLIEVYSKNLTDYKISRSELVYIEKLFEKVCTVADAQEKNSINDKYTKYHDTVKNNLNEVKKKLDSIMNSTHKGIEQLTNNFLEENEKVENKLKYLKSQEEQINKLEKICTVIFCLILLAFTVGVGKTDGIGAFFVALLLFDPVIWGLFAFVVLGIFDKKRKHITDKIDLLNLHIKELQQEYDINKQNLEEVIERVENTYEKNLMVNSGTDFYNNF